MRRLRFLGREEFPDVQDAEVEEVDVDGELASDPPVEPALLPVRVEPRVVEPLRTTPPAAGDGGTSSRVLRPRKQALYRDKRAWSRRRMLAGFLGLPIPGDVTLNEPVDIERAAGELSEDQRQGVSMEADLDRTAPPLRVLDFLEEVMLAAASGASVEGSLWAWPDASFGVRVMLLGYWIL